MENSKKTLLHVEGLRRWGFVHVTGLTWNFAGEVAGKVVSDIPPTESAWNYHDEVFAVHVGGAVWIRAAGVNVDPEMQSFLDGLTCRGGSVPCSRGESLPFNALLKRVADPYWTNFGEFAF